MKKLACLLLSAVLLISGCSMGKITGEKPGDIDVAALRQNSGRMLRITKTNDLAKSNDNNNWTFVAYDIDWSGVITRSVGYRYTEARYSEETLNDEDYGKLVYFAEYARLNDPYKDYSEESTDGTSWTFKYTYSNDEPTFTIYHGSCNKNKDLKAITDMIVNYFYTYPLTAPYTEEDTYDYITDGIEPTKNSWIYRDHTRATVEEFKEYYGLADGEIDDELIENFIFDYGITPYDFSKQDYADMLKDLIKKGKVDSIGYRTSPIKYPAERTNMELEEFIYQARWIYIVFYFPDPETGSVTQEDMMIDLKHNMIYYNCDKDDYRNADLVAELTDDDIEWIRQELPKTVINYGLSHDNCLDYEYEVNIVDCRSQSLYYYYIVPDEYNLAFDAFWREVYEKYFGISHI